LSTVGAKAVARGNGRQLGEVVARELQVLRLRREHLPHVVVEAVGGEVKHVDAAAAQHREHQCAASGATAKVDHK
jgi:hypothetical protein